MRPIEYLEYSIENKLYYDRSWFIDVFTVTRLKGEPDAESLPIGKLVHMPWGCQVLNADRKWVKIKGSKANTPLFTIRDKVIVKPHWVNNLDKEIESTVGRLMVNLIAISEVVGNKIPYINKRIGVKGIDKLYAAKLESNPPDSEPRDPDKIYVDEFIKYTQAMEFLSSMSNIFTVAATPKNLLPPKGLEEFKKELSKKYEGKLSDPVEVANYEAELQEFDKQYLKDDPSFGYFTSGKILHTSRKKLYLGVGVEQGFETTSRVKPILSSLSEGIGDDVDDYVNSMNGLRYGSYSRGAETVDGGVSAKTLLRAANDLIIEDTDCGTTLGIPRRYNESDIKRLVKRNVIDKNGVVLVENIQMAHNYVDKDILVRSPMFCKLTGERRCRVCAGERLNRFATGLAVPLTNVSSGIIIASLKKMHVNTLVTSKMELSKVIT